MATAITRTDELPAPPAPGVEDAIDDALVGLPAPPRVRVRVLGVLLTAISVVSMFLAWQLRDDVRFALGPTAAIEAGDGRTLDTSQLLVNRMVHFTAAPQMAGAVRYTRPLYPGEHVVFPVAGRTGAPLYVQVDGTSVDGGDFVGRVVSFGGVGGRYAGVGQFLAREFYAPIGSNSLLIVTDVTPRSTWWAPLLFAFLLALAFSDIALLVRLVRPIEGARGR